jgi:NAD(P)-dependent dehydrogenase (short-subunit alcohol dehydrogenase family)
MLFSLEGRVAIVTRGTGVLGGAIAQGLAAAGAQVVILGRRAEKAADVVQTIEANGGKALALSADVLQKDQLAGACTAVRHTWGHINILVNAAVGNMPEATIFGDLTFFDLSQQAFEAIMPLNLTGTLLPCQVFGAVMAQQGQGSIINTSSMSAQKPLSRVLGYGNAKAAVDNFTKWLACKMAGKYVAGLRVNAITPAFSLGSKTETFCSMKMALTLSAVN